MQEYYQPEQTFSISIPQPVFEISKISVFWFQWSTTQREEENRAKEQVILHVDKLTLYCTLHVYYFGRNLPASVYSALPFYLELKSNWMSP